MFNVDVDSCEVVMLVNSDVEQFFCLLEHRPTLKYDNSIDVLQSLKLLMAFSDDVLDDIHLNGDADF